MISVSIDGLNPQENKLEFPMLAADCATGKLIVLFINCHDGVVLKDDRKCPTYIAGYYCNVFTPVNCSNVWRILNTDEKAVLSNR